MNDCTVCISWKCNGYVYCVKSVIPNSSQGALAKPCSSSKSPMMKLRGKKKKVEGETHQPTQIIWQFWLVLHVKTHKMAASEQDGFPYLKFLFED